MKRMSLIVLITVAACPAVAQGVAGEDILRRVEDTFRSVKDYTVTVDITVDLERLNVPPMHVTMYFKQPDKVHFSSTGFALLPKESIGFTTSRLLAKFNVERVEERKDSAGLRYDLTLKPKVDKTGLRRLVLTVNPEHWIPERLAAPQFDGRTMEALFRHENVGEYWLPVAIDVCFTAPGREEHEPEIPGHARSSVQRNGRIAIRFSDYHVNTGLDDAIFEEQEEH